MPTNEELKERARRGGIKSGETRRAKAKLRADFQARQLFVDKATVVAQEMLDAALGQGTWAKEGVALLDPRERAGLLKVCLEYGVGRPRPQDPLDTEPDEDGPKAGIGFGTREDLNAEASSDGQEEGVPPVQAVEG